MKKPIWVAAAFGGLLAACQPGTGTIYGDHYQGFYTPGLVNYTAARGYMPVAVYGQPFGPDTGPAVAKALYMPAGHVQVPFQATPEAQAGEGGRIVLLFDSAGPAPIGEKLCRLPQGRAETRSDPSTTLTVAAAFCHGEGLASEARMVTARPASPDDPKFRRDLGLLMYTLLPPYDPNQRGDCNGGGMFGC